MRSDESQPGVPCRGDGRGSRVRSSAILGAVVSVIATSVALGPLVNPAAAATQSFSNASGINILDVGAAAPFPSDIGVGGVVGTVTKVTVTVTNFTHTCPKDVDILLVGPHGQNVMLMSDTGDCSEVARPPATLTFDDAGAAIPCRTASDRTTEPVTPTTGTYAPTEVSGAAGPGTLYCETSDALRPPNPTASEPDSLPAPAPPQPYGTALSAFNGVDPNGTWHLYVNDDSSLDSGSISGWTLNLAYNPPPPPPPTPPSSTGAPQIQGTALPGDSVTCTTGSWSGSPTGYAYQWYRSGMPISGATGPKYTVQIGDEAETLTCAVTASSAGGTGTMTSNGVLVAVVGTLQCPRPTGRISGTTVGPVSLGELRARARKSLTRYVVKGSFDDFCLYGGWGIRVGYPSNKLLGGAAPKRRTQLKNRIVLALTANPYYSLGGVKPGSALSDAIGRLKLGRVHHIGLNDWYVTASGGGVLKVRDATVQEIGIANSSFTKGYKAQGAFLSSFSSA